MLRVGLLSSSMRSIEELSAFAALVSAVFPDNQQVAHVKSCRAPNNEIGKT